MTDPRIERGREYLAGVYTPSSAVISDLLAVIAERDAEAVEWQRVAAEQTEMERDRAEAAEAERDEARAAIEWAETLAGEWERLVTYELQSSTVARVFADALRAALRGEQ